MPAYAAAPPRILNLEAIAAAPAMRDPYPYIIASNTLPSEMAPALKRDFPDIRKAGYLPLSLMKRQGAFDALLKDMESPELAEILSEKLGVDLRGKPCIITVRKYSDLKAGNIHNDGQAKLATSLVYLNDTWPEGDAGRLRVLRNDRSFDDTAAEVPPTFGTFFAFARTDNSWHGHKPFAGERRVIQAAWVRSWEDYERKIRRGRFSAFFKRLVKTGYE
ncbi:MAG: 2OG-Fe(II) oxygenase, partial [Pseudomonadota bacterium]|nr:2OG-Fe(II) oxygenase [Pseudomonadota bacterium]